MAEKRNVAAIRRPNTGRNLFESAASGGALATGQRGGEIRVGANADLVVLDDDSPMLAGHHDDSLLDALVFSGFTLPIDRVMSKGVWQVVDGTHINARQSREDYARIVRDIGVGGSGSS